MRCSTSVRLVLDVAVTQGGYARVLPSRYSQTWGRPRPPLAVRYYARSRCAGRGCGVRVFDATVRIEKPPSFVAGSEWTEFAHDRVPDRNCFPRSEEHTSELQSLMRISYAVFCLKKKKRTYTQYSDTKK